MGGVGIGFFCPTPKVQFNNFLHHTPKLGIPVEMVQCLFKLLLKQSILAVRHDFYLLVATKLLTAKLHSLYVKEPESEILERSDILPPNPQLYCKHQTHHRRTSAPVLL